ncbi:MAG: hypothetical protein IPG50_36650 [Myxococcales bacterium]|nr:hypothetical protein [Myxococcales bacterium]
MKGRRSWIAPAIAAAVLLVLLLAGALLRGRSSTFTELRGVRLGMTVRDVRARFDATGLGQWDTRVGDDLILSWRPTDATRDGPIAATFEFHLGVLMAIRADVPKGDPAARGSDFELSDSAVIVRDRTAEGPVRLTVIARSCPIHRKEAADLVQQRMR